MKRILIVDDDGHIREVVRFALEKAGYFADEAKDGEAALARFADGAYDLIILDITMPGMDGLDVCRRVRSESNVPIIFLSSRDEELDKVLGLELGADDYLAKPFSPRELVARVKAVLRRGEAPAPANDSRQIVHYGGLAIDAMRHRCTFGDEEIVLTVTEFAMLRVLAEAPGRVYTRGQLVDRACGADHVISDRTVDSHIRRIRKKLALVGSDLVETVHGLGYRMRDDA